ncbi:hypothetical protein NT2_12_01130 [Caenibius tardaugens NBRC 16725]|uniref:Bacterial sugar transferase domain-containing protein n=1 Tax=Caenibius tardaugens NBRC 16725 TaxID=1219035 RepID=U3A7Y6_9SPHN|nr:sugar transferase [Caenibius tardaugens]AZI36348.1 polyprenyl glycosylphosphotransferase [Caenibius tardaugens NBRC 16725]GAD50853.1 hypothetical protein NT2_12_01130 [Caenibius tardaugens NBRC 16725]
MTAEHMHLEFGELSLRQRALRLVRRWLTSNRFAIGGALFFGVIVPELFHPLVTETYDWARPMHASDPMLIAAIVALLFGHIALRRTSLLPFVDAKVIVLPVFVITFSAVFVLVDVLFDTRSYYHLPTSFCAGVAWYTGLAVAHGRLDRPIIVVVGAVDIDTELRASRIRWVPWASTRLPHKAQAIVYDSHKDYSPEWERFFARAVLRNIPVYDLDHLREMLIGRVTLRSKPELVFGRLLPSEPYLRIKRVVDFGLALVVLLPVLLIMAGAALLIRCESAGGVLFRQTRVGYQGRLFTCYKLRTMRSGVAGPLYTQDSDPRITRIGRFLRKSRIDELPQIFNVLRGDMSWIGPRPEAVQLSREYEKSIPYYRYRHSVRPGISGWAAVHQGNVALTDAVTRKLEYDFYYIKYFSIWLDYVIVLMTIRTIVTGKGSR